MVHVTSVDSGCGCTIPSVTPTTVQPYATALVTAIGTPLSSGERTVAITVHTDSPLSPEIVLHFKMITDRVPPFITAVAGDFAYPESYAADEGRDFLVTTVESGQLTAAPIVKTDLPFLSIAKPRVREAPYDESSLKLKTYTYRVTFNSKPETESFTGSIWAVDPGTGAKTEDVLAFHRAKRSIIAVPSAVTLSLGTDRESDQAQLTLLTEREMPHIVVDTADEADRKVIEISEMPRENASRLRRFLIRASTPGRHETHSLSLRVKENAAAAACIVVPVTIRGVAP